MSEAYIVAACRTAGGKRGGRLAGWHPVDMAARIIDELIKRADCPPDAVEDVILGVVGTTGPQATNIGRNAVLASSLPLTVPGVSVDRQCGSSQQTIHFAAQAVMSGAMDIVIAGGVESMTKVPMGSARTLGEQAGLGNYRSPAILAKWPDVFFSQFDGAEMLAEKYGLSKAEMDQLALESHQRAEAATKAGKFAGEILPLAVSLVDGSVVQHATDEGIRFGATLEKIASVKVLREGGRVTAASSSQICDGAAGVLVVNAAGLKRLGVAPLARIHTMTVLGGDPVIMLEAPIPATEKALKRAGLSINDIGRSEVNEAFASVPMSWAKALGADPARMNALGGSIALGHPLGGSGARIMTTLINELRREKLRYGLQTMCENGGMANVTIIEAL